MRLPTMPTRQVVDHLNATYFQQLWNAPRENARANVRLEKVATRVKTGVVPIGQSVVGLPTTDTVYAVYQTGYRVFGQYINLPDNVWVLAKDYLSSANMSILLYGISGRTAPVDLTYIRYMSERDKVLVAVPVKHTKQCIGELYPTMYLTVFRDLTRATPSQSRYYVAGSLLTGSTPTATIVADIANAYAQYPDGTYVTVNGWVYHPAHAPTIVVGDIVEINIDPDIIAAIDITVDDNHTGYYSSVYEEYRELIHIPKSVNPQNVLINTDNLTAIVYDPATNKGVLGHRVATHAVEPVTHNDFSMSRTAITGFTQSLSAVTVKVRLLVRFPVDRNYLNEDVNHLKDLYSLPDAEILNQLLGLSTKQIAEWKASALEASPFLTLLAKDDRKSLTQAIPAFTAAMGYYDVGSVVGQQIRYYTYKNSRVKIVKPKRLFGYRCQAIVYANGIKIPESRYTITDYDSQSFLLGFSLGSGVGAGDRICVYILEEGYRTAQGVQPVTATPSFEFDSDDYAIFEKVAYTDPKPVWGGTASYGYRRMPKGDADYVVTSTADGGSLFTFRMKHFGKSFYCIPQYGLNTATYDLTDRILHKNPIVIPLTTIDNLGATIPILGYATIEVYLNGKRLILDLDCVVKPVLDDDGFILQNLLTITNCDYLNLEGGENRVEVCVHGDTVVSQDTGYVIENKLFREELPMIYSKSSSRVYVRGVLQENVSESGNVATIQGEYDNGAPFLMEHYLAYGAEKLMRSVSPNQDINLRSRIEHVLGITPPVFPDTIMISHLHALYSVFLAKIVTDVGEGSLVIKDEPSDAGFLRQFKDYVLLLDRDPVVGSATSLVDRRFTTLAAHYANFGVSDPVQMERVQRLTTLTLTPSDLSILTVLL